MNGVKPVTRTRPSSVPQILALTRSGFRTRVKDDRFPVATSWTAQTVHTKPGPAPHCWKGPGTESRSRSSNPHPAAPGLTDEDLAMLRGGLDDQDMPDNASSDSAASELPPEALGLDISMDLDGPFESNLDSANEEPSGISSSAEPQTS